MFPLLIADLGLGPIGRDPRVPIFASVGAFVLITLVEAAVLRWLGSKQFKFSLLDSFIMNTVSTLLGIGLAFMVFLTPKVLSIFSPSSGVEFILFTWLLSAVIEFVVMRFLGWPATLKTFLVSAVANFFSYVTIVAWILVVFQLASTIPIAPIAPK